MVDKNYELLNDVSYDESEFDTVEECLTDIEKKKIKKALKQKIHKKRTKRIGIAASMTLAAAIGVLSFKPAFAQTIAQYVPILDSVYEKLGYFDGYKDFTQYIGMSKEDKGYKFTIDKLVADDDTVMIALRIYKPGLNVNQSPEAKTQFMMVADVSSVSRIIMGGGVEQRDLDNDTSLVVLENQAAPGKKMPKRFNMRVNIHSQFDGDVNVNFDLPVSREKISSETIVKKNVGKTALGDRGEVKVSEVKASPLNTSITYSFSEKIQDPSHEFVEAYAYDDKGRIYFQTSGWSDDGGYISKLNKIENDANKLYIVPYIWKSNSDDGDKYKDLDSNNKFFSMDTKREFDFKDGRKINIYNIEKNKDNIKIYYTLQGDRNTYDVHIPINLFETKGEKLEDKVWVPLRDVKWYKPDLNKPDNYCLEFTGTDISKDYVYSIGSFPISSIIEGKAFEIDLK